MISLNNQLEDVRYLINQNDNLISLLAFIEDEISKKSIKRFMNENEKLKSSIKEILTI